jgi:hypothetical protein
MNATAPPFPTFGNSSRPANTTWTSGNDTSLTNSTTTNTGSNTTAGQDTVSPSETTSSMQMHYVLVPLLIMLILILAILFSKYQSYCAWKWFRPTVTRDEEPTEIAPIPYDAQKTNRSRPSLPLSDSPRTSLENLASDSVVIVVPSQSEMSNNSSSRVERSRSPTSSVAPIDIAPASPKSTSDQELTSSATSVVSVAAEQGKSSQNKSSLARLSQLFKKSPAPSVSMTKESMESMAVVYSGSPPDYESSHQDI